MTSGPEDRPIHAAGAFQCPHDHCFLSAHQKAHEHRTWAVIALTLVTMVVEIVSGIVFGSMALLADGWHMASHASAMGITALAYYLARRHQDNPRFAFGTGKVGDLAGYTSALLLAVIAVIMAYESIRRLVHPVSIHFNEAMMVAVIGLAVNLASAFLLKEDHHHHHHPGDDADHHHHHDDSDHDPNLRAAYLHVLADALTSILAIVALGVGKVWGWTAMDPLMGVVGAIVISRWSYGLLRETGGALLDYLPSQRLAREITEAVETADGARVDDLHVWRLGPGHHGAIIALTAACPESPEVYKDRLRRVPGLSHVTVEVNGGDMTAMETNDPSVRG